jgi:hypothetical protein
MKQHRKSLNIRIRSSKPNHSGGYSKGYKIYKQKNHQHDYWTDENMKGETVIRCKVPRCDYIKINGRSP